MPREGRRKHLLRRPPGRPDSAARPTRRTHSEHTRPWGRCRGRVERGGRQHRRPFVLKDTHGRDGAVGWSHARGHAPPCSLPLRMTPAARPRHVRRRHVRSAGRHGGTTGPRRRENVRPRRAGACGCQLCLWGLKRRGAGTRRGEPLSAVPARPRPWSVAQVRDSGRGAGGAVRRVGQVGGERRSCGGSRGAAWGSCGPVLRRWPVRAPTVSSKRRARGGGGGAPPPHLKGPWGP